MAKIDGTNGDDQLNGGGGDDIIRGLDGDDEMFGGAGNDTLNGGAGLDQMRGGAGNDTFIGTDPVTGTIGNDKVFFHEQTGLSSGIKVDLAKGTGTDGLGGRDTYVDIQRVTGTYLDDTLLGSSADESFSSEDGDDYVDGRGGWDFVTYLRASGGVTIDLAAGTATGAAGNDVLLSFEGASGTNFKDAIYGTDRTGVDEFFQLDALGDSNTPNANKGTDDFLDGRGGVDAIGYGHTSAAVKVNLDKDKAIDGTGHIDTLKNVENAYGSQAGDKLTGAAGEANRLVGQGGADSVYGLSGSDNLYGGDAKDYLEGGKGGDTLNGDAGADRLVGGAGDDAFQFFAPSEGGDRIADFSHTSSEQDRIEIDASGFGGGLTSGTTLGSGKFVTRGDNHAQDGNDRFILRTTDDTLWFDEDGQGGTGPVLVADLQAGVNLTASDILLI